MGRWRADVSVDPSHASSVSHGWWFQHFGSWASAVGEVRHQRHLWTSCKVTNHRARSHKHHGKAKPQLSDVLRAACSELQHLSQLCRASSSTYLCLHHCCSLPTGSGLTAPLFFCVPAVLRGWAAVAEWLNISIIQLLVLTQLSNYIFKLHWRAEITACWLEPGSLAGPGNLSRWQEHRECFPV